jgi:hypothetical protein
MDVASEVVWTALPLTPNQGAVCHWTGVESLGATPEEDR